MKIAKPSSLVRAALALTLATAFAMHLAACNTVEGAGKDVKSLGKGVEETASDNKPK
jgi:predicted small secreted protein